MPPSSPKGPRGRPRTVPTEAVLQCALESYWHGDPADVSVNAICQRAGVAKPSLYRAFGSEDGLMRAALQRYADEVLPDLFVIFDGGRDLQGALSALLEFATDDPRMATGCLFHKLRMHRHRLGPQTRAAVEAIEKQAEACTTRFLQERLAAGDWQGGVSPAVGARYLFEQLGLAIGLRASGEDPRRVRALFGLALSVFRQP